jgi:hypothetical protein
VTIAPAYKHQRPELSAIDDLARFHYRRMEAVIVADFLRPASGARRLRAADISARFRPPGFSMRTCFPTSRQAIAIADTACGVATVGCGLIGQKRTTAISVLGHRMMLAVDRSRTRAVELAEPVRARATTDVHDAVEVEDIDAVVKTSLCASTSGYRCKQSQRSQTALMSLPVTSRSFSDR